MKKIVVSSRSKAKEFISDVPWAAISISDHRDDLPKLNACQRVGLLQLVFEDTEFNTPDSFKLEHAKQIIEFVREVNDKIEVLLVHCFAGWSRSPAVAAAIDKMLNKKNITRYWEDYEPNMLVFDTIVKEWGGNGN